VVQLEELAVVDISDDALQCCILENAELLFCYSDLTQLRFVKLENEPRTGFSSL